MIRSFEPGESWFWSYPEEDFYEPARSWRRRSTTRRTSRSPARPGGSRRLARQLH